MQRDSPGICTGLPAANANAERVAEARSNMGLWFKSTKWRSWHVKGRIFRPDAEGYVEIPEDLVDLLRDPTFVFFGTDRPQKPAESHPVVTMPTWSAVAEPPAAEAEAVPSGVRTNRAVAAEEACRQWLSELKARPASKDTAFKAAKDAMANTGH